ncbi:MAG TPA: FG-GAP-like repeat-containing protein [Saprospiraceae bacterium]|nr:FG-GAP-like repeat-containing protein [Saprospiraceae bacterium]HNT19174.1 FG-GAP-like repeat-containing protein [Saprospiraceae bacterium]
MKRKTHILGLLFSIFYLIETSGQGALYTSGTFTKTVNTALPVGTVAASADVDLSGAATYTIPIVVPPGTNGVVPSLSILYNSLGGYSVLGQGWSITGMSSISRIPKTIYHDGNVAPVELTTGDRYSLDGSRLVLKTGTYGAAGSTYGTESENFATITAFGSIGTGPQYLTVFLKDGRTMEYGGTSNSRAMNTAQTQVMSWLLSKITYPDGNYIEYSYNNGVGVSITFNEINYTGNTAAGLTPYNKIKFNYVSRSDVNTVYEAGTARTQDKFLDNITITGESSAAFKIYQFNYGWDNINSYLNEIIEKGSNGSQLNSTIFKYGDQPTIVQRYGTNTTGIQDGNYYSGDFDGDGFSDLVEANKILSDNIEYCSQIRLFKAIPAINQATSFSAPIVKNLAGNFSALKKKSIPDLYTFLTNDFSGDGIDDFAAAKTTGYGGTWAFQFARIYNGSNTTPFSDSVTINAYTGYSKINSTTGHFLFAGDFNGDGKGDLLSILGYTSSPTTIGIHIYYGGSSPSFLTVGTTGTINIPVNNWQSAKRIQVLDFNGDGKSDLMVTSGNNSEIYTIDGYVARSIYYAGFPTQDHLPFFGDFNGDRKMDILYRSSTTLNNAPWYKCLSTGTSFDQSAFTFTTVPTVTSEYSGDKILLMDCNGDGKTDIFHGILGTTSSTYHVYFSRGSSFYFYLYTGTTTTLNTMPLTPFDYNGDGKSEILVRTNYLSYFDIYHFMPFGKELFLEKVKNGYDYTTQWIYKRMNESGTFYNKGPTLSGNVNNIQLPMHFVSEIKMDNGIGGMNSMTYNYAEAKLHKEGKGFLGFKKINSDNAASGFRKKSENEFNLTYYVAAPYKDSIILISNGSLVKEVTNSNQFLSQGTGRYWYRINNVLENKVFEGRTLSTANSVFDSYGNVTSQVVNNNSVETTTTTTTYGQYGTPVPALPTSVTVSNTRTGQTAYSSVINMTYNSLGQMLTKVEFVGQPKAVTTTYYYNNLGNQISARISASGITARNIFSSQFDTMGRWPNTTTTPVGVTYTYYHSLWGKPYSVTDIMGLITSFSFDAFGREISMTTPQFYNITTSYNFTTSYGSRYYKQITHPHRPDIKIYNDVLDRERRTETEGWQNQWITTEKTYTANGEVFTTTGPYKSGETGLLTTFNYDGYRRLASIVENKGGTNYTSTLGYVYASGNLTTTSTNPASQVSSKVSDATGKTISATDYGGTLNYAYYSHGGLKTVINGASTLVTNNYDVYARQSSMVDINAGTTSYDYDALGQLITQVNAKSQTHTMTYDTMGRILTKTMPEGTTTYEYYQAGSYASIGKIKKITGFAGDLQEYTYNGYGDLWTDKQTVDGVAHTKTYTYDASYSNVSTVSYPSSFALNYNYDANGYLSTVKNTDNSVTIFTNGTMNGYDQYKTYSLGNGKSSTNTYFYGIPTNYSTTGVQNLSLNWNHNSGNLTSRVDGIASKTETFGYDNLNRLTSSLVTGLTTYTTVYSNNGNISSKTDAGTYAYTSSRINAVTQINPSAGTISSASQSLPTYSSFLQPTSLTEGINTLNYTYGYDENRIKSVLIQNGSTTNTRYFFGDYEKDITGGSTKYIHYINAGDGLMAIVIRESGTDTYYYTYTDHLGSILNVTNNIGTVVHNQNFDAWGRYRNYSNWTYSGVTAPPIWLTRGFTGHEHLELFKLINMNGRLYDPIVGRMLAVDNYVQFPEFSQAFNRYSYVLNNPLKYNDPSGEIIPLVFAGAALIGGGLNLWSNFSKVQNFGQGLSYFMSGFLGGGISVVNPLAGGSYTATTNVLLDISYGHLPQLDNVKDITKYAFHVALDAFGASGAGKMADLLGSSIFNYSWRSFGGYTTGAGTTRIIGETADDIIKYNVPELVIGAEKVIIGADGLIYNAARFATKTGTQQGGLNLFKWGAQQTSKSTGWKIGDYMLHLPNKGLAKLNWKANYSALRSEMNLGKPIFDSYRLPNGNLIPTGGFLNAERYILHTRGWIYSPSSGEWIPPIR